VGIEKSFAGGDCLWDIGSRNVDFYAVLDGERIRSRTVIIASGPATGRWRWRSSNRWKAQAFTTGRRTTNRNFAASGGCGHRRWQLGRAGSDIPVRYRET
jgi:hypothetical protein